MEPAYLVLDEADSLLDGRSKGRLIEAVWDLKESGEVGVLWATQHPESAALCDRLVVLCSGEVVADGDPGAILSDVDALRRWGLAPAPSTSVAHHLRRMGIPLAGRHLGARSLARELKELGFAGRGGARRARRRAAGGKPSIAFRGVGYSYGAGRPVIEDLSTEISPGEALAVGGPCGAGKSTVALLSCGALAPSSGEIARGEPGRAVGLCTQLPEEQFCASTVEDEVLVGASSRRCSRQRARELLSSLGLDPSRVAGRSPFSLSEGEKKKVCLASALSREGALVVLDEPTLGLDGPSVELVVGAVRVHLDGGGSAVIASHNGDFLVRTAQRLLLLGHSPHPEETAWTSILSRCADSPGVPRGQLVELFSLLDWLPSFDELACGELIAASVAAGLIAAPAGGKALPDPPESALRQGKWP